jgi:hypothetical protein
MRIALAAILLIASLAADAALSEAEKNLLNASVSADRAAAMGRENDATGLARIIALGDPNLVSSFSRAMPRSDPLPPAIEALVLAHFDDARVGNALQALAVRYQTRALFDRFYAAAQKAYQDRDPVFEYILRTDQPGIDEAVLKLAPRFSVKPGWGNPALNFLGARKYPGAVDPLIKALSDDDRNGSGYGPTLYLLIHYDSPEVWRRTGEAIERMHADGSLTDNAYKRARAELDAALKDPVAALANNHREQDLRALSVRRNQLTQVMQDAARVRSEPAKYVEAQSKYLARLWEFSSGLDNPAVTWEVAREYTTLGLYVLLTANDPRGALPFLEKAALGEDDLGMVALADTLEQVGDKPAAIRAYETALAVAQGKAGRRKPFGSPVAGDNMNEFWRTWFAAEIEYLRTGKTFRGRVSEPAITGFWAFAQLSRSGVTTYSNALSGARVVTSARAYGSYGMTNPVYIRGDWPEVAELYKSASSPERLQAIAQLPASRISLLVSMAEMSTLQDPAAILSGFARDDPSGFWTTIVMATVAYHEGHGRDGALEDGVAKLLPGMAAPARPNALATAARRFVQSRGLRVAEKK